MRSVNECHLIGHAGKDAETRYTSTGKMLVKFSLATGGGRRKDGGNYDVDWHRCQVWGEELGQIAGAITKGQAVEIYGRITYGSYEKDGRKVYTTDITCTRVLDPDGEHDQATRHQNASAQPRDNRITDDNPITDEDIPF